MNKKWLGTIVVASILLILALMGGTWGTSYAAQTHEAVVVPVINTIDPTRVLAGGSDLLMTISSRSVFEYSCTPGCSLLGASCVP